jgi:hypothetical protein
MHPSARWQAYQPIRWDCSSRISSTSTSSTSINSRSIIRGTMKWPHQHISVTCHDSTFRHPRSSRCTKRRTRVCRPFRIITRTRRPHRRRTIQHWTVHPAIRFLRQRHPRRLWHRRARSTRTIRSTWAVTARGYRPAARATITSSTEAPTPTAMAVRVSLTVDLSALIAYFVANISIIFAFTGLISSLHNPSSSDMAHYFLRLQ